PEVVQNTIQAVPWLAADERGSIQILRRAGDATPCLSRQCTLDDCKSRVDERDKCTGKSVQIHLRLLSQVAADSRAMVSVSAARMSGSDGVCVPPETQRSSASGRKRCSKCTLVAGHIQSCVPCSKVVFTGTWRNCASSAGRSINPPLRK